MHLYSALLCIAVHPKRFTILWGGGGGSLPNHHQCAASTWMMRQQPQDNGGSALTHTSYRWRGERVIEPIKWMEIIRRPWLTRASGGNLASTPGLYPYSLREVAMEFLMTTESQDLGLTSHPKDRYYCLLDHQWYFNRCNSLSPFCEVMDLGIVVSAGKGSNMQMILWNQRMCRSWGIFLNSWQFKLLKKKKVHFKIVSCFIRISNLSVTVQLNVRVQQCLDRP